jgi:hypothetical protein
MRERDQSFCRPSVISRKRCLRAPQTPSGCLTKYIVDWTGGLTGHRLDVGVEGRCPALPRNEWPLLHGDGLYIVGARCIAAALLFLFVMGLIEQVGGEEPPRAALIKRRRSDSNWLRAHTVRSRS